MRKVVDSDVPENNVGLASTRLCFPPVSGYITRVVSGLAYFWCCQVQFDIFIERFDILKHNCTQNVFTYDHHLCCLQ